MIEEVHNDPAKLERFLALPATVYRGDPNYCAASRESVLEGLQRPRFQNSQRILLAMDGDQCVARLVARRSPALTDESNRPVGMIGFFEALNRPEQVVALLRAAVDWLRQTGAGMVVGPMDGDTWHKYRFNVGPFELPPFLMEPYNPAYYPDLWEACGFQPLEEYYSKHVSDITEVMPVLEPILQRVISRGYRLRPLRLDKFRDELTIFYRLSTEIFADNFLYEDISEEDFAGMYEPVKSLVDPRFVWFAQAPDDTYAGFLFATHDYHAAVTAMRGERGLLAKLRFSLNRGRSNAVNLKSLGVLRRHRRSGLAAALMCQGYKMGLEKGYRRANLCLIREGNPSGRLDGDKGTVSRRYRLYKFN